MRLHQQINLSIKGAHSGVENKTEDTRTFLSFPKCALAACVHTSHTQAKEDETTFAHKWFDFHFNHTTEANWLMPKLFMYMTQQINFNRKSNFIKLLSHTHDTYRKFYSVKPHIYIFSNTLLSEFFLRRKSDSMNKCCLFA